MNFSKENIMKALIRAVRTFAQSALSMITVGKMFNEIDWMSVLSVAAVAAIYSLLMSIATGLPESETDGTLYIDDSADVTKMLFSVESEPEKWQSKDSIRLKVDTTKKVPSENILEAIDNERTEQS